MAKKHQAIRDLSMTGGLAVISAIYLYQAISLPTNSPNEGDLGPRVYPLLLGALLAGSTILLAVQAFLRLRRTVRSQSLADAKVSQGDERAHSLERQYLASAFAVVVVTVVYLQVLEILGFLIASALYLAAEAILVGGSGWSFRRWGAAALFGCLGSVGIYLLFANFLGVLLPKGLLSF